MKQADSHGHPVEINSPTWRASRIGPKARDLLAGPDVAGTVLAATSSTIYLAVGGGEVVWIGCKQSMHRRCVLAVTKPNSLVESRKFTVQGHWLLIGEFGLYLKFTAPWEPRAIAPSETPSRDTTSASVRRLLAALRGLSPGEGLGRFIPLITAIFNGGNPPPFPGGYLEARAQGAIVDLARACVQRDLDRITRIGPELIGLGPGLTPSGDDYLGGLLFGIRVLNTAYPGEFPWEPAPVLDLIAKAQTLTNPISYAVFSDLAFGHGPAPLHELSWSLLSGQAPDRSTGAVYGLLEIGHTTGWDILGGFLTAMLGLVKN